MTSKLEQARIIASKASSSSDDSGYTSFAKSREEPESLLISSSGAKGRQKKKKSMNQEERIAANTGGRRIPYSGAKEQKGDAEWAGIKFECKRTDKKSIRISEDIIKKIYLEAMDDDMEFAIQVDVDGFDNKLVPNRFVILTQELFEKLVIAAGWSDG